MPNTDKFLTLEGLSYYDSKIKGVIANSQVKADWNEKDSSSKAFIQNKPFGIETLTRQIKIRPAICTGTNGAGLRPVDISSCISSGEYQRLEAGQVYNVTYKNTVYENIPVQELDFAGMHCYYIGNWDSVLLRSNLIPAYDKSQGALVDSDLPFLMLQWDPDVDTVLDTETDWTDYPYYCAFAFFTEISINSESGNLENQALTITDASDSSKTYSLDIAGSRFFVRTPFEYTDPELGSSFSGVIEDGQAQTINVDGTDYTGAWKVEYVEDYNCTVCVFVPQGCDFDELFPNGFSGSPDREVFETWPFLIVGADAAYAGYLSFQNMASDFVDYGDPKGNQIITFSFDVDKINTLDDKYLSQKYQYLLAKDYELAGTLRFGINENGGAFAESDDDLLTNSMIVSGDPSLDPLGGNDPVNPQLLVMFAEILGESVVFSKIWDTDAKFVWNNQEYIIPIPLTPEYPSLPVPGMGNTALATATLGELKIASLNQDGALGFVMYLPVTGVENDTTFTLEVYNSKPVVNPEYLPKPSKSDWNEIEESSDSYIQNRTHYDDNKVFLDLNFELTQEILQELDWQGGGGSGEYSNIPYTGTHPWKDAFIDAEDVENLPYIRVDAGEFDDDGYHKWTDTLVPLRYDISKIVFTVKYNGVLYSGTPYLIEAWGEEYYGLGNPTAINTYKGIQVTDPLPQPEQANFPFALWIEYQSAEGAQEGINHVGIICGSRPVSAGDYGVKIEYKDLKKLDAKYVPTAAAVADNDAGFTTGNQVYDYIEGLSISTNEINALFAPQEVLGD